MKNKIVRCRAKSAYGLLSAVKRLILAEPLRYNQSVYIARIAGRHAAGDIERVARNFDIPGIPACGTMGCVAGWVVTLQQGDRFRYDETKRLAEQILGLSIDQSWELFTWQGADPALGIGSPAYAAVGAAHISKFQEKYKTQLKNKMIL